MVVELLGWLHWWWWWRRRELIGALCCLQIEVTTPSGTVVVPVRVVVPTAELGYALYPPVIHHCHFQFLFGFRFFPHTHICTVSFTSACLLLSITQLSQVTFVVLVVVVVGDVDSPIRCNLGLSRWVARAPQRFESPTRHGLTSVGP